MVMSRKHSHGYPAHLELPRSSGGHRTRPITPSAIPKIIFRSMMGLGYIARLKMRSHLLEKQSQFWSLFVTGAVLVVLLLILPTPTSSTTHRDASTSTMFRRTVQQAATSPHLGNQSIMKIGPVRLWKSTPPAFVWQALVNRTTALASASESSNVPHGSPLHQALSSTKDIDMLRLSKNLFTSYVPWLCTGKVTLGFLKAAVLEDQSIEVRDRFIGLALLRLGKPTGTRFTERTDEVSSTRHASLKSNVKGCTSTQCVWSFPITGGLLTAPETTRMKEGLGKVVFVLKKTSVHEASESDTNVQCSIRSELVGYRPFVVGRAPANVIRTGIYLGSQSMVHAWVMWRFHRRCRELTMDQIEQIPQNARTV